MDQQPGAIGPDHHSVLGFQPFTPNLPDFTSLTFTPTPMASSTPELRPIHSNMFPTRTFPSLTSGTSAPAAFGAMDDKTAATTTILLVLLPIIFGSLLLVAVFLGVYQWNKARQKEQERRSGLRAAHLRRASSPAWITEPVPLVLRDLETGRPEHDTGTRAEGSAVIWTTDSFLAAPRDPIVYQDRRSRGSPCESEQFALLQPAAQASSSLPALSLDVSRAEWFFSSATPQRRS